MRDPEVHPTGRTARVEGANRDRWPTARHQALASLGWAGLGWAGLGLSGRSNFHHGHRDSLDRCYSE